MRRIRVLLLIAAVGAAGAAALHPGGKARFRMIEAKINGRLPIVSWIGVIEAIPPQRWRDAPPDPHPFGLSSGRVTFGRLEEGDSCPVLWETPLGEIWGRMEDESLLEWLIAEQLSLKVYDNEQIHVRPGDTVLDLGAHLGTFTDFALHHGAAKVIAFEPEPTNVNCLEKTFAEEIQAGKVVLVDAAVSDHSGELHFDEPEGHHASARGKLAEDGKLVVRATTIDETVSGLGLETVDFIKMDIEGAERLALAGARETLQRFSPRMALCVYHREDDRVVVPSVVLSIQPEYEHATTGTQAYFFPRAGK